MKSFGAILQERLSRRGFVALGAAGVAASLPSLSLADARRSPSASIDLVGIAPSRRDDLLLSPELKSSPLLAWGDPLWSDDTGWHARDLRTLDWLDADSAARQARRFGANNDAIVFFPDPGETSRGLLCVNHEYVTAELSFAGLPGSARERAAARERWIASYPQAVAWMQAAHGVSVVRIGRERDGWQVARGAPQTRRITATTPMDIMGPARGHALLRTNADPSGTRVFGTFANCSAGRTPWGTFLTSEENIDDYFGKTRSWASDTEEFVLLDAFARFPTGEASLYGWEHVDRRFDVRAEPREQLRFGWIVEIDPQDPTSTPRKRTALGRFSHESATTIVAPDGRVVVYMGDDDKFEYAYKFVSRGRFDPKNAAANRDLLDHGTLYAARFDASGRGEWLPLVHDEKGPLNSKAGFKDQGAVVIKCRAAADLMGATPMDRIEDFEPNPLTGRVYMACTKNADREQRSRRDQYMGREIELGVDIANPRAKNDYGHIIEVIERGDDPTSRTFAWNVFILAGDPRNAETKFLTRRDDIAPGKVSRGDTYYAGYAARDAVSPIACPDNVGFDPSGRLWIVTDSDHDLANDGCFVVPTHGAERGRLKQIVSAPVGAEVTGCEFTPDGKSLFLGIQHPGEGGTVDAPASHWPDGDGLPARSALVVIERKDGRPL